MAHNWTDNQPFVPASTVPSLCCGESKFTQLISPKDEVHIQITADVCDDAVSWNEQEVFMEGEIYYSYGMICCNGNFSFVWYVATSEPQYFATELTRLTITVDNYESGSFDVFWGAEAIYTIQADGVYTFFLQKKAADANLNFGGDFVGCFSIDEVFGVKTNYKMALFDNATGKSVHAFTPEITGEFLTFKMSLEDVEDLQNGCYYWGLIDPCTALCGAAGICNVELINDNCWTSTVPGLWQVGGGKIEFVSPFPYTWNEVVFNSTPLCTGKKYRIKYTIESISALIAIRVGIGNNTGEWRVAEFTYEDIIEANASMPFPNNFFIQCNVSPSEQNQSVVIKDLSIELLEDEYTSDEISVPFHVRDVGANECGYFMLEGCNADNAFGFEFAESGFMPFVRLAGELTWLQPEIDGEIFRKNSGDKVIPYWDRIWKEELRFDMLPSYIHKFLSVLIGFDRFFVNGVLYAPSEASYQTDGATNNPSGEAGASLQIEKKAQKIRKVSCSSLAANCSPRSQVSGGKLFQSGAQFLFQTGDDYHFQNN